MIPAYFEKIFLSPKRPESRIFEFFEIFEFFAKSMSTSDSDTDTSEKSFQVDPGRFESMMNMFKVGLGKDNAKIIARIINKKDTRMSDVAKNKFKVLWTAISEFRSMFHDKDGEIQQSLPYQETLIEILHMQGQQTGAWKLVSTELTNPFTGKIVIDGWAVHGLSKRECQYFHDRANRMTKKLQQKFEEANPPRLSEDESDPGENGKDEGKNGGKNGNEKGNSGNSAENHREENEDDFSDNDEEFLSTHGYPSCDVVRKSPLESTREALGNPEDPFPNPNQPILEGGKDTEPPPKNGPFDRPPKPATPEYGPYHPLTLQKEEMAKNASDRELERARELQRILDYEPKSPTYRPNTPVLSPARSVPTLVDLPTLDPILIEDDFEIPSKSNNKNGRPRDTPYIDYAPGPSRPSVNPPSDLEITVTPTRPKSQHREDFQILRQRTIQQRADLENWRKTQKSRHSTTGVPIRANMTRNPEPTQTQRNGGTKKWTRNRVFEERDPYRNFRSNKIRREENLFSPPRRRALTAPSGGAYKSRHHDHRSPRRNLDRSRFQVNAVETPSPTKRRQKWTPPSAKRARNGHVDALREFNNEFRNTLQVMTAQFKQAIAEIGIAANNLSPGRVNNH